MCMAVIMAKTYVDRPVDGIRWPVGPKKDPAETHYISSGFCDEAYHYKRGFWHPGEDWNGKGGGDSDLGDDVYTIADGRIVGKDFYPCLGQYHCDCSPDAECSSGMVSIRPFRGNDRFESGSLGTRGTSHWHHRQGGR